MKKSNVLPSPEKAKVSYLPGSSPPRRFEEDRGHTYPKLQKTLKKHLPPLTSTDKTQTTIAGGGSAFPGTLASHRPIHYPIRSGRLIAGPSQTVITPVAASVAPTKHSPGVSSSKTAPSKPNLGTSSHTKPASGKASHSGSTSNHSKPIKTGSSKHRGSSQAKPAPGDGGKKLKQSTSSPHLAPKLPKPSSGTRLSSAKSEIFSSSISSKALDFSIPRSKKKVEPSKQHSAHQLISARTCVVIPVVKTEHSNTTIPALKHGAAFSRPIPSHDMPTFLMPVFPASLKRKSRFSMKCYSNDRKEFPKVHKNVFTAEERERRLSLPTNFHSLPKPPKRDVLKSCEGDPPPIGSDRSVFKPVIKTSIQIPPVLRHVDKEVSPVAKISEEGIPLVATSSEKRVSACARNNEKVFTPASSFETEKGESPAVKHAQKEVLPLGRMSEKGLSLVAKSLEKGIPLVTRNHEKGVSPAAKSPEKEVAHAAKKPAKGLSPADKSPEKAVAHAAKKPAKGLSPAAKSPEKEVPEAAKKSAKGVAHSAKKSEKGVPQAATKHETEVALVSWSGEKGVPQAANKPETGVPPVARNTEKGIPHATKKPETGFSPIARSSEKGFPQAVRNPEKGVTPVRRISEKGVSPAAKKPEKGVSPAAKNLDKEVVPVSKHNGKGHASVAKSSEKGVLPVSKGPEKEVTLAAKKLVKGVPHSAKKSEKGVSPDVKKPEKGVSPAAKHLEKGIPPLARSSGKGVSPGAKSSGKGRVLPSDPMKVPAGAAHAKQPCPPTKTKPKLTCKSVSSGLPKSSKSMNPQKKVIHGTAKILPKDKQSLPGKKIKPTKAKPALKVNGPSSLPNAKQPPISFKVSKVKPTDEPIRKVPAAAGGNQPPVKTKKKLKKSAIDGKGIKGSTNPTKQSVPSKITVPSKPKNTAEHHQLKKPKFVNKIKTKQKLPSAPVKPIVLPKPKKIIKRRIILVTRKAFDARMSRLATISKANAIKKRMLRWKRMRQLDRLRATIQVQKVVRRVALRPLNMDLPKPPVESEFRQSIGMKDVSREKRLLLHLAKMKRTKMTVRTCECSPGLSLSEPPTIQTKFPVVRGLELLKFKRVQRKIQRRACLMLTDPSQLSKNKTRTRKNLFDIISTHHPRRCLQNLSKRRAVTASVCKAKELIRRSIGFLDNMMYPCKRPIVIEELYKRELGRIKRANLRKKLDMAKLRKKRMTLLRKMIQSKKPKKVKTKTGKTVVRSSRLVPAKQKKMHTKTLKTKKASKGSPKKDSKPVSEKGKKISKHASGQPKRGTKIISKIPGKVVQKRIPQMSDKSKTRHKVETSKLKNNEKPPVIMPPPKLPAPQPKLPAPQPSSICHRTRSKLKLNDKPKILQRKRKAPLDQPSSTSSKASRDKLQPPLKKRKLELGCKKESSSNVKLKKLKTLKSTTAGSALNTIKVRKCQKVSSTKHKSSLSHMTKSTKVKPLKGKTSSSAIHPNTKISKTKTVSQIVRKKKKHRAECVSKPKKLVVAGKKSTPTKPSASVKCLHGAKSKSKKPSKMPKTVFPRISSEKQLRYELTVHALTLANKSVTRIVGTKQEGKQAVAKGVGDSKQRLQFKPSGIGGARLPKRVRFSDHLASKAQEKRRSGISSKKTTQLKKTKATDSATPAKRAEKKNSTKSDNGVGKPPKQTNQPDGIKIVYPEPEDDKEGGALWGGSISDHDLRYLEVLRHILLKNYKRPRQIQSTTSGFDRRPPVVIELDKLINKGHETRLNDFKLSLHPPSEATVKTREASDIVPALGSSSTKDVLNLGTPIDYSRPLVLLSACDIINTMTNPNPFTLTPSAIQLVLWRLKLQQRLCHTFPKSIITKSKALPRPAATTATVKKKEKTVTGPKKVKPGDDKKHKKVKTVDEKKQKNVKKRDDKKRKNAKKGVDKTHKTVKKRVDKRHKSYEHKIVKLIRRRARRIKSRLAPRPPLRIIEHGIRLVKYRNRLQDTKNSIRRNRFLRPGLMPRPGPYTPSRKTAVRPYRSLSGSTVDSILASQSCKLASFVGYNETGRGTGKAMASLMRSFLERTANNLKMVTEREAVGAAHGFGDPVERVLYDSGVQGIAGLRDFYRTNVIEHRNGLLNECKEQTEGIIARVRAKMRPKVTVKDKIKKAAQNALVTKPKAKSTSVKSGAVNVKGQKQQPNELKSKTGIPIKKDDKKRPLKIKADAVKGKIKKTKMKPIVSNQNSKKPLSPTKKSGVIDPRPVSPLFSHKTPNEMPLGSADKLVLKPEPIVSSDHAKPNLSPIRTITLDSLPSPSPMVWSKSTPNLLKVHSVLDTEKRVSKDDMGPLMKANPESGSTVQEAIDQVVAFSRMMYANKEATAGKSSVEPQKPCTLKESEALARPTPQTTNAPSRPSSQSSCLVVRIQGNTVKQYWPDQVVAFPCQMYAKKEATSVKSSVEPQKPYTLKESELPTTPSTPTPFIMKVPSGQPSCHVVRIQGNNVQRYWPGVVRFPETDISVSNKESDTKVDIDYAVRNLAAKGRTSTGLSSPVKKMSLASSPSKAKPALYSSCSTSKLQVTDPPKLSPLVSSAPKTRLTLFSSYSTPKLQTTSPPKLSPLESPAPMKRPSILSSQATPKVQVSSQPKLSQLASSAPKTKPLIYSSHSTSKLHATSPPKISPLAPSATRTNPSLSSSPSTSKLQLTSQSKLSLIVSSKSKAKTSPSAAVSCKSTPNLLMPLISPNSKPAMKSKPVASPNPKLKLSPIVPTKSKTPSVSPNKAKQKLPSVQKIVLHSPPKQAPIFPSKSTPNLLKVHPLKDSDKSKRLPKDDLALSTQKPEKKTKTVLSNSFNPQLGTVIVSQADPLNLARKCIKLDPAGVKKVKMVKVQIIPQANGLPAGSSVINSGTPKASVSHAKALPKKENKDGKRVMTGDKQAVGEPPRKMMKVSPKKVGFDGVPGSRVPGSSPKKHTALDLDKSNLLRLNFVEEDPLNDVRDTVTLSSSGTSGSSGSTSNHW